MTYDQIYEWVREHFSVGDYNSPQELIQDVRDRFEKDNMYFPDQASANINEGWREEMQLNQPRDYDIDELQRQRYEEVQRDLDQKFREFEGSFPEQQYREYVTPLPEPETTRPMRQPDYSKEAKPGFFARLRRWFRRRE